MYYFFLSFHFYVLFRVFVCSGISEPKHERGLRSCFCTRARSVCVCHARSERTRDVLLLPELHEETRYVSVRSVDCVCVEKKNLPEFQMIFLKRLVLVWRTSWECCEICTRNFTACWKTSRYVNLLCNVTVHPALVMFRCLFVMLFDFFSYFHCE